MILLTMLALGFSFSLQADPLPSNWVDRIKLNGDFRFRHEYTSKGKEADTSERHQERMRLRLGLQGQVNETITAKVKLAGADSASPISTNVTMTDNASKKPIYFDQAMVEWKMYEGATLNLGKQDNPLRVLPTSQLIYDVDYTPEGASMVLSRNGAPLFVNVGAFSILERGPQADGTSQADSYLLAAVGGFKKDFTDSIGIMLAGGFHNFTSLKNRPTLLPGFLGNSNTGGAAPLYENDFQVAEILGLFNLKSGFADFSFYMDALSNVAIGKQNTAFLTGVTAITRNDDGKAGWTVTYNYMTVAKNATPSAINNSDFAGGIDGSSGHLLAAGHSLAANTTGSLTWYRSTSMDPTTGRNFNMDKGILDFVFSF